MWRNISFPAGKIKKTSKEYVFITHAAECNILAIKKKSFSVSLLILLLTNKIDEKKMKRAANILWGYIYI